MGRRATAARTPLTMLESTLARIPLPSPDEMTPEQRRVYELIVNGPRGTLVGPLRAALHRPELAEKWQQLGELLRYRTSLPPQISEIAILVTARRWRCQVEWHMHAIAAAQAGIAPAVVTAIKSGRRPLDADAKALAVYDYAVDLTDSGHVKPATYNAVLRDWGVAGIVELTALIGYYTMVAMTLNAHEIPLPAGAEPPFPTVADQK
jgi:4-carboxymuconolactone decarboxylase